jgi:hypothetical protein
MKRLTVVKKMIKKKIRKLQLKEDYFEVVDCKDFQNVKGANLVIDPLTY